MAFTVCRCWNEDCFYRRTVTTDSGASKSPPVARVNTPVSAEHSENGFSSVKPPQDLLKQKHLLFFKPFSLCLMQQRTPSLIKRCFVLHSFWNFAESSGGFLKSLGEEHMETSWFFKMDYAHVSVLTITVLSLLSDDGLCYPHLYSVFTYFPCFPLPVFETALMWT